MLLIIIFCVFREDSLISIRKKKHIFNFALLPVFAIIAFKAETVGADTSSYYASYEAAREYGMSALDDFGYERIEPGYKLMLYLLTLLRADAQWLSIIVGGLVVYTLSKVIRNNASNWSLALFFFVSLGFFQFAMSGIRQTIAVCISMLSYNSIRERNLLRFLLLIALAASFHKSVIVFIPAYFIANQRITTKRIALMFISIISLLFVADKLLLSAADLMNYDYGIEKTNNGYLFFGLVLFVTFLVVKNRHILIEYRQSNKMVININFISLALWFVRLMSRTAERVSLYFMPYTYIALAEYLATRSSSQKRAYTIVALVLGSLLALRRLSAQEDLRHFYFFFF